MIDLCPNVCLSAAAVSLRAADTWEILGEMGYRLFKVWQAQTIENPNQELIGKVGERSHCTNSNLQVVPLAMDGVLDSHRLCRTPLTRI